jgi:excinuclease ABC subunit C
MRETLEFKLKTLPVSPGVYFHKDKTGQIIYVGKAAVLKNRVKQYFQKSRNMDVKTRALVAEIADTDWIETESEVDALFLEAEMVKRYMPRYNILLRDDRSLICVWIDMKNYWPSVSFTRNPADDGADYYGPYFNSFAVKKALRYLRRVFPYYDKPTKENAKPNLYDHLGLTPLNMTIDEYKANLRKLISYIKGDKKTIVANLERDMKLAAKLQDFEKAAEVRNQLRNLHELQRRIMFGNKEFLDISKDEALGDLTDLLNLSKIPVRIEGYDISHMSGVNVVASMVVFKNGVSDRGQYRKFKTRVERNDDFANMNEIITRRFNQKNIRNWGKPDLVLIDGGKGQLDAALQARDKSGYSNIPFIGLAKRDERIVIKSLSPTAGPADKKINTRETGAIILNSNKLKILDGYVTNSDNFSVINLPKSTHIIKFLQRIRDESHRFAVSYHTVLKRTQQTTSSLDEISGIGPKTRLKLIRKFGSIRNLKIASESEITSIVGQTKAKIIKKLVI